MPIAMNTLVIKNLPERLHEKLRQQARANRRSVTKEAICLIEAGVQMASHVTQLTPPLKLRSGYRPTIDDIESAIAQGQE